MIFISHRGNLEGPRPERENDPTYINEAIESGFDVEIDVWVDKGVFWLGHDSPRYKVEVDFLKTDRLWCHAKNMAAMERMADEKIHHFWHENDKYTITSKGIPWCFPNNYLKHGITVVKEPLPPLFPVKGICTDIPIFFRNLYSNCKI